MGDEEGTKTDYTAKIIELTKENETLKTQIKAFEDAGKLHQEEMAKKDGEITKLNKLLVDNLLTRKDPSDNAGETVKSPMDLYAEQLNKMAKAKE